MMNINDGDVRSKAPLTSTHALYLMNCGFTSGLLQAFIFNPWDRALYLSVKLERPFLSWENFRNPMSGVFQTVLQRAISAGLYFPIEELSVEILESVTGVYNSVVLFSAGTVAGVANGIIMNPFTRVKYHYWGKVDPGKENFLTTATEILRHGGIRQLFVGTMATVHRDLVFGGVFSLLRHQILPRFFPHTKNKRNKNETYFSSNLLAGAMATILSSPLNYVRNIHYATPPTSSPQTAIKILEVLWKESLKESSSFKSFRYLQHRLRIGWGTARVACGMAVGSKLYEVCAQTSLSIWSTS